MKCSAEDVTARISGELAAIIDADVQAGLRARLVEPTRHLRNWDYGKSGEQYPCWTIAEDPSSDTAIVYSEHGFGPGDPWGIVFISHLWFGMDSAWFLRLEDAFVGSGLASDLPIWDVVAQVADQESHTVASSMTMGKAYEMRDALSAADRRIRYHVLYRSLPEEGIP